MSNVSVAPLRQFKSHILGRNADVTIWSDRIEYEREGGLKLTRIIAAYCSLGITLCFPWGRQRVHEARTVLPLKSVTSVASQRSGPLYTQVLLSTSSGHIAFRVSHAEAPPIVDQVTSLIL